jgi:glycosyltransferase involved in cell wall biosynthesis
LGNHCPRPEENVTRELRRPAGIRVDAVVPVYNEQSALETSIRRLHGHLAAHLPYDWRILIADNGSTDGTAGVARTLCGELDRVDLICIGEKGRGRALRTVWLCSKADVVSYMDVDLSTRLDAYCPLIRAIAEEGHDVAIGRRLGRDATVVGRKLKREITSRGYNLLIRLAFGTRVRDAQCGFKAISRRAADMLLPQVVDDEWFFDTELLIRAERSGCEIKQVPVYWTDDHSSHVKIVSTALQDLKGIWRLKREGY